MKEKLIIIALFTLSTFAGGGSDLGGWKLGGGSSTTFKGGTGDLGGFKTQGGSGSGGNGLDIINYFDSLQKSEKTKELLELPQEIKIEKDRDFISPINRWTLKTVNRDLLTNDQDHILNYDDLTLDAEIFGIESIKKDFKKLGFKQKDFQ